MRMERGSRQETRLEDDELGYLYVPHVQAIPPATPSWEGFTFNFREETEHARKPRTKPEEMEWDEVGPLNEIKVNPHYLPGMFTSPHPLHERPRLRVINTDTSP